MQKLGLFYSWQGERVDSSEFIRRALGECAVELSAELCVILEICDADTNNRGSYDINAAIKEAIANANIVIADLTPTSHGADGRINPNANALFEYATAMAMKGHEVVLAVADVVNEDVRRFPFDFNHHSMVTCNGTHDVTFKDKLKHALCRIVMALQYPVLHDATTVFFSQRIGQGFPGVRGLKVYEDPNEIALHLDAFFKAPIEFGEALHAEGDRNPLWWFRGSSAEEIDSYVRQKDGIVLLGWEELKIRRIAVFACHSRYYSQYLYVEVDGMPPVFKDRSDSNLIERAVKTLGYCDEEYAVIEQGGMKIRITREQYDDGYIEEDGEIVPIHGRAKLRCRFLSPYNFIVAAKFGAYNCAEFCRTSEPYFEGILNKTINLEEFHDYLMSFPKPLYRGR